MTNSVLFYHVNSSLITNTPIEVIQFDGREHIVAPVVLITEGVHAGSGGPVYYSPEELSKSAQFWNGVPLPVYHPTKNNTPISCNSPDVIQSQSVGNLWEVEWDDTSKKLRGKIYIDVNKAQRVSPVVLEYLRTRKPLEVSTGLFFDEVPCTGVWNGEQYNGVVKSIRPDHLALLPGAVGACSWSDGCGVRVNTSIGGVDMGTDPQTGFVRKLWDMIQNQAKRLFDNEMSLDNRRSAVRECIDALDTPVAQHYVTEVFDGFVIYSVEPGPQAQNQVGVAIKLYKRDYTLDEDGNCTLSDQMQEVKREVSYVPVVPVTNEEIKIITQNPTGNTNVIAAQKAARIFANLMN